MFGEMYTKPLILKLKNSFVGFNAVNMKIVFPLITLMLLIFSGCAIQPKISQLELKQNADSKLAAAYYEKAFEFINQSDDEEAKKWVEKSAELGHSKAQFLLGYMIDTGTAGYTLPSEAAHWYAEAARQGNMDAQFNLGIMSEGKRRVPEHYRNAVERKINEEAYRSSQINTVFVGKLLGYEDIPLVQPSSCFEPNVLCMDVYVTYKIKVLEVLAGESLSGVINASRFQHGRYMYRGSDESLFVVTKISDDESKELLKASHYLKEHHSPRVQYCFSEPLDHYIPELKNTIYSNCPEVSDFRGKIKMDFLRALVETVTEKLEANKTLIEFDEGYSINGVFISDDEVDEDEETDECNFGYEYMDYDRYENDPNCMPFEDVFDVAQYVVKKGEAQVVKELITKAISQSKFDFSNFEMKFKTVENESSSVLEWRYRKLNSVAVEAE